MKLLVAGSRGQLGSKVVELAQGRPGWDVTALDHTALDVTREADVHKAVRQAQPDWVINCTAYNDVEKAESDSDQVHLVNDVAVGYLADAALAGGARLVHVSTDYVFSGDFSGSPPRPYRETDPTAPLGAYGRSKLAGEERLTAHPVGSIVLRTSWVYGGPGKNFVETMIAAGEDAGKAGRSVRVVYDQESTPTDAWSLATQVLRLLSEVRVEPVRLEEFPSKARRPHYSVLENKRLDDLGINVMPPWKDGLRQAWRRIQARRSGTDG
jgi:dTDP-4-dehydrorhamnose reductase